MKGKDKRNVHGKLNASWKISSLAVNGQSFLVIDGYLWFLLLPSLFHLSCTFSFLGASNFPSNFWALGVNLLSREGYSQTGDRMCQIVLHVPPRDLLFHQLISKSSREPLDRQLTLKVIQTLTACLFFSPLDFLLFLIPFLFYLHSSVYFFQELFCLFLGFRILHLFYLHFLSSKKAMNF